MKGWSENSIVQENGLFIDNKINKTNQNYPVGGKQDSWQAGQGMNRIQLENIRRRTGTELQTQGNYKGSKRVG